MDICVGYIPTYTIVKIPDHDPRKFLFTCVKNGNHKAIQLAIKHKININYVASIRYKYINGHHFKISLLCLACIKRDMKMIKLMCDEGNVNILEENSTLHNGDRHLPIYRDFPNETIEIPKFPLFPLFYINPQILHYFLKKVPVLAKLTWPIDRNGNYIGIIEYLGVGRGSGRDIFPMFKLLAEYGALDRYSAKRMFRYYLSKTNDFKYSYDILMFIIESKSARIDKYIDICKRCCISRIETIYIFHKYFQKIGVLLAKYNKDCVINIIQSYIGI